MSAPSPDRGSRSALRVFLGLVVSGGLLALVLSQLDTHDAWSRVLSANLGWLAASFGMIAAVMVLRGLRFWVLTDKPTWKTVVSAVCLQNFFNRVAPFRLGELSLPYLLKRGADEPVAPTMISLLLVRLLELWVVIIMAGIASWIYLGSEVMQIEVLIGLGVVVAVLLLSYRWCLSFGVRIVVRLARSVGLMERDGVARLMEQLQLAVLERERLSLGRQTALWSCTIAVVVLNQVAFDFLLRALGYDLSFLQVIVGVSATQLFGALPLPTVGSVGTHEAGWVVGFMLVGLGKSDAIVTGVASQVISLAFNAVLALPAYVYLAAGAADPDEG